MSIWAIIPVKPLNRAKSRLAEVLSPAERERLAERMFRRVIAAVKGASDVIAGTLVISRDPHALAIARDLEVATVQESGAPELNAALMRATQVVIAREGAAVLILPADLPLILPDDVRGIAALGRERRTVVIATDDREDGTNALLVRPPGALPYAYGVGSYRRHISDAEAAGLNVRIYQSSRLALDIDVPADLDAYAQRTNDDRSLFSVDPMPPGPGA